MPMTDRPKSVLAEKQWAREQEERRRAPVWTVADLKEVLNRCPDDMEIDLAIDWDAGETAWLRSVSTLEIIADMRKGRDDPGNRKTILILDWNPPELRGEA